jgi:hypothetical protein
MNTRYRLVYKWDSLDPMLKIKHLTKRKAPEHDNIILMPTYMTKIINATLWSHYFPNTWKEANIISIPTSNKNPTFP